MLEKDEPCLEKLRGKNPEKILFGDQNLNSIGNKCEYLEEIIKNMFDVFLVLECKLDLFFSDAQFQIAN